MTPHSPHGRRRSWRTLPHEPVRRAGADLRLLRAAVFTAFCVALSAAGHVLAGGASVPLWTLVVGFAAVLAVAAPLAGRERSLSGIATVLVLGQLALHTLFAGGRTAGTTTTPHTGGGSAHDGLTALAQQLLCNDRAAAPMSEAAALRIVSDAGLGAGHVAHGLPAPPGGGAFAVTGATPGGAGNTAAECLHTVVRSVLSVFDGPMLLGHLLAALATGWLLHRGDAALWRLVRLSADAADSLAVHALRTALRCTLALSRGLLPDDNPPSPTVRADRGDPAPPHALVLAHSVSRRGPPRRTAAFALAA